MLVACLVLIGSFLDFPPVFQLRCLMFDLQIEWFLLGVSLWRLKVSDQTWCSGIVVKSRERDYSLIFGGFICPSFLKLFLNELASVLLI